MSRLLTLVSLMFLLAAAPGHAQTSSDLNHFKLLIARNAKALNFNKTDLENYRISSAYYDEGADASMVYIQQTIKGVDVYNALTVVAFKNENLMSVQSSKIEGLDSKVKGLSFKASVTPISAVNNTIADLKITSARPVITALSQTADGQEFEYDNLGIALNNITARLMWIPNEQNGNITLAWQVSLLTLKENNHWLVNVDAASGRIIRKDNLTSHCSFIPVQKHNVYVYEVSPLDNYAAVPAENQVAEVTGIQAVTSAAFKVIPYPNQDPNFIVPTLVSNPWTINGDAKAYTKKWNSIGSVDYKDSLKGNNVFAYEDINYDNKGGYSPPSSTALPNLTWNFTPDFTSEPLQEPPTKNFGITNLFYWNNMMHDMSYNYGFNEVSGNEQSANFNRGGKQLDFVLAEAFDGGDSSNANFAPTVDGQKGRMQMFLWRSSPLKTLKFNSPADLLGPMLAQEGAVSNQNKLTQRGVITGDVVFYKDALDPNSHRGCGAASNNAQLAGKIAYIDRGGCTFAIKIKNAQTAGAKSVIVGDSLVIGSRLVTMIATPIDNTITIPAVFVKYDDAQRIKNDLNANILTNATLSPSPHIDGDLDNGVIAHEYTHGISNRLTGGPSTVSCLNNGEQMGEGWSDYFALMMTTNWATATKADSNKANPIGNYAAGYTQSYGGIRSYPYSKSFAIDPWTYDSLRVDTAVHEFSNADQGSIYYTGEVWCSALWDMTWNLITTDGINKTFFNATKPGGNTVAMKLVMQAMKLQKCSPGCVDGRNAILSADTLLYAGIHSAQIWKAFARRGLGFGASQGSNTKIKDGTASYLLPPGISLKENTISADAQIIDERKPIVQVMPNPAKDYVAITVKGNNSRLMVQIVSEGGAQVGTYTMNGAFMNINISKLAAGVYNVLISGDSVSSKYKLVVQ